MKLSKLKLQKASLLLLGIGAFSAFLFVAYFIWFCMDGYFSSDCADTIMWAKASVDSGKLFDPSYHYGGVYPFGGTLIMIPAIWFFGLTMTAEKFGMFCFLILFVAAIIFFCRSAKFSWKWTFSILFVVLATLSCSTKLRELYFEHIIYYSLGNLQLLVGGGLILRYCNLKNGQKRWPLFALSLLWIFLCSTNNMEGVVLCGGPLLLALGVLLLSNKKKVSLQGFVKTPYFFAACLFVAIVLGYFFGKFLTKNVFCAYASAYSGFSEQSSWPTALQNIPFAFISLMLGNVNEYIAFQSKDGIFAMIDVFFAIAVFVLPFIATCFYNRYKTFVEKFIILTHWFLTMFIGFAFIFGRLDAVNWRLSPLVLTSLLCAFVFIRYLWNQKEVARRFAVILLICSLLVSGIHVLQVANIDPNHDKNANLRGLSAELEKTDIAVCYATFWNAQPITFHTNGKIEGITVDITDDGSLQGSTYQSFDKWYAGHPDQNCALILTQDEYSKLNASVTSKITNISYWNQYWICQLSSDVFPLYQ